ncbi:hypothetical protein KM043_014938 [Ampulex compressa]|nr:hypothetical protein KM043_014938 [Ampulex compressa]
MSEGADSITQTCENSLTTLKAEDNPEELPPRIITYTGRRPRFGTGNAAISPYIIIDGKKLRSAVAYTKKWPPRRVSFPTNDTHLVTGYLEPANPLKLAENVNRVDLISAYKESCARHNTDPLESVIIQLENLDISDNRTGQLDLKGVTLDQNHSEPLEEILKRVQFDKVNLEGTSLDEESSVILFDMLEYYESAKHLNISCNQDIGARGWQACSHMIKKTQCLEQLEAKDVTLNEQYMTILSRTLRLVCHLHVLKLENCGLSGRAIVILVTALKMNTGIRELYLADNGLDLYDAIQLGSLLRLNNHLQLLDISNNNIQDEGVHDILEGLINQVNEDKDGKGLNILILWNNRLTQKSSPYFNRIITFSKTLETLNIGQNMLTDEMLITVKEALKKNHVLLQLGMQSTELTCSGIVALSEVLETNKVLRRIDLRDNSIQMTGMRALTAVLKTNKSVTQVDLDDKPRMKIDGTLHQYMDLVGEIRGSCTENEKRRALDESTEGSESPQHHTRHCSASSRKISLTCQTLPCSSPSMTPMPRDDSGRTMLEPKRTSGGRLRSPAPSPIPSPVASPIPSPSRSRFVVSRVPEASLRSTDSSASSSPVTPPSLGSSPTRFFPTASGSSRFRVSVVESASTVPSSPKPVVASPKDNVTIGFNFKIDKPESIDDPGVDVADLTRGSGPERSDNQNVEIGSNASSTASRLSASAPASVAVEETEGSSNVGQISTNRSFTVDTIEAPPTVRIVTSEYREDERLEMPLEPVGEAVDPRGESTKDMRVNRCEDSGEESAGQAVVTDGSTGEKYDVKRPPIVEPCDTREAHAQAKRVTSVQRHTSNLEKLLALFQNPGSLFSDTTATNEAEQTKSTFQEGVNTVMSLGDKFHHYLRDGKDRVNAQSMWSSDSAATKVKSSGGSHVSTLQSLTSMFTSFKLDTNLNLFEQRACSKPSENAGPPDVNTADKDVRRNVEGTSNEKETDVSATGDRSLPDNVQSKGISGYTEKEVVLQENGAVANATVDTCYKVVNNGTLVGSFEGKSAACTPKLMDIPEYSVLELRETNLGTDDLGEVANKVDSVMVIETTCDRFSTDSINSTSDSNPSCCNITCDIRVMNDVHNVDNLGGIRNSVSLDLNPADESISVRDAEVGRREITSTSCGMEHRSRIDDTSAPRIGEDNYLSTEVTNIRGHEVDDREDNRTSLRSSLIEDLEESKSTTVNSTIETRVQGTSLASMLDEAEAHGHEDKQPREPCSAENELREELALNLESLGRLIVEIEPPIVPSTQSLIPLTTEDSKTTSQEASPKMKSSANSSIESSSLESSSIAPCIESNAKDRRIAFQEIKLGNLSQENSDSKTTPDNAIPALVLTHHLSPTSSSTDGELDYNKSCTEDLIFCMTDISTEGIVLDEELSPGNWSSSKTSLYDLPQASPRQSSTNLLIERAENVHRNSQDSGIGETNLSTLDDIVPEQYQPRESFQESVDSGIESESSSVCVKTESAIDGGKDENVYSRRSASNSVNELGDFDSGSSERTRCTDAVSGTTHLYFGKAKRAAPCSAPRLDRMEAQQPGMISEETDSVLAEPPAVINVARRYVKQVRDRYGIQRGVLITSLFTVQSNASESEEEEEEEDEEEEEEEDETAGDGREENYVDMNDYEEEEDEVDELEEMTKYLEPKYQRYARWRI